MSIEEAKEALKYFNEWRRDGWGEQPAPKDVGESIDLVLAELDAYKAHVAELKDGLNYMSTAQVGPKRREFAFKLLKRTPSQPIAYIQAQAVTDLISECSYSGVVDGVATSIIDVDSAISYADRLGEG